MSMRGQSHSMRPCFVLCSSPHTYYLFALSLCLHIIPCRVLYVLSSYLLAAGLLEGRLLWVLMDNSPFVKGLTLGGLREVVKEFFDTIGLEGRGVEASHICDSLGTFTGVLKL
jgi:hypothetical protein